MYHQQQNKWYPKDFYSPISMLHIILAVQNLLAHNDITIIKLLWTSQLATAEIERSFKICK